MNTDEIQMNSGEYFFDKIERLVKEKKKTKRDLAKALKIEENSINRTIRNPNIKYSKLKIIADFLGVEIIDLLSKDEINTIQDREVEDVFKRTNPLDNANQLTINSLSTALERSTKTVDRLVQIISENFPDKKNLVENIR